MFKLNVLLSHVVLRLPSPLETDVFTIDFLRVVGACLTFSFAHGSAWLDRTVGFEMLVGTFPSFLCLFFCYAILFILMGSVQKCPCLCVWLHGSHCMAVVKLDVVAIVTIIAIIFGIELAMFVRFLKLASVVTMVHRLVESFSLFALCFLRSVLVFLCSFALSNSICAPLGHQNKLINKRTSTFQIQFVGVYLLFFFFYFFVFFFSDSPFKAPRSPILEL